MENFFSGIVKDEDFNRWINQFEKEDQKYIQKLLPSFKYFSADKVFELLNILYQKLRNEYNIEEQTTLFVPVGYIAKSGAAITYFFRRENNLDESRFIAMKDMHLDDLYAVKHVVFLDDFIGTGKYIESINNDFIDKIPEGTRNRITFICACVVGYEQGIEKLKKGLCNVCVATTISYQEQPLYFDFPERQKIIDILLNFPSRNL